MTAQALTLAYTQLSTGIRMQGDAGNPPFVPLHGLGDP